jgi:hypothetical protein
VVAGLVNRQQIASGRAVPGAALNVARAESRSTDRSERPTGGVVQRVLAHNQPISAVEVTDVEQLGGKMVFRLSGAQGDSVIVKFEAHIDVQADAEARLDMTHDLATQVIDNVPGMSPLTDNDIAEIVAIPNQLGDAALLQTIVQHPHTRATYLCIKKANVAVGKNLREMVDQEQRAGPKRLGRGAGVAGLISPSQKLLQDAAVVRSMGRAAAFDLFVGNDDRFRVQPRDTQLENIDFAKIGAALVNLDQFDPNRPIRPTTVWDGAPVLTNKAAMLKYATELYHELFTAVGLPDEMFDAAVAGELAAGMVDAVKKLKGFKGILTHVANNPAVGASPEKQTLAAVLLQRIALLP